MKKNNVNSDISSNNNIIPVAENGAPPKSQIANSYSSAKCERLSITSLTTNNEDRGNKVIKATDNDLGTKWTAKRIGSYLQADLGSLKTICSLGIVWDKGEHKSYNFIVSTSRDGSDFQDLLRGSSTKGTGDIQIYDLHNVDAQYVRVTLLGTDNNNNGRSTSITEISINGVNRGTNVKDNNVTAPTDAATPVSLSSSSTCNKLSINGLTASPSRDNNVPANTVDNNLNTYWSSSGFGAFIQADLSSIKNICSIGIAWYKGDSVTYRFEIAASNDSSSYHRLLQGRTSGTTLQPENYDTPDIAARYLKITVFGNSDNNEDASVSEIAVYGTGNAAPKADDKVVSIPQNTAADITLTGTDPDQGDTLTFAILNKPSHGSLIAGSLPNTVKYTPSTGYHGPDSFTYQATDNHGAKSNVATVSITVNAAPKADAKNLITLKDTPVDITLTGTDPDQGDTLTFAVVNNPSHGAISVGAGANTVKYTPSTGYHGPDSFTYQATDNHGAKSNVATVSITVNAAPMISDITVVTLQNTPIQISLKGIDQDQGDTLTFAVVNNPSHGIVSAGSTQGSLKYTPNSGYTGSDSFTYQATDNHGAKSNVATVGITVNKPSPVNNPPSTDSKSIVTTKNTPVEVTLTGSDPDQGDTLTFAVADPPAHGTVATGSTPNSVRYTPSSGFVGPDSFTYTAADNHGAVSTKAMVSITVKDSPTGNEPPTVQDKSITTVQDTPAELTLTGSDPDQGDTLTFAVVNNPSHGIVSAGSSPNSVKYTPNSGYTGSDSFTYQATDNHGAKSNVATVSIAISAPGGGGGSGVDKFGIKKIYSTKSGGEEWFMNMQDPNNDKRTSPPSMTKNSDGSWKVTSGKVRYGVFTSSGYHPDQIKFKTDQKKQADQGYMQSPNDWKNVEMTGQVKFNSGDSSDSWTWYARGGTHTGNGNPDGCEGTAYKADLFYASGNVRWAKEQWHVHYVFTGSKSSPASSNGKFVGFKGIMYNMQQNGKTVVKLEIWVDPKNDNTWQKVYDFVDSGGWGDAGGECGGAPDQIMTWGGPIATFRWDNANDVSIKNLSVREIQPPQ